MREELITQIIEAQHRMRRVIRRERTLDSWVKLNLTTPQLKSLFYISRHGRMNLSGLASGIRVTPANVTGIVDRLIEQGLLTRTLDPDDRRVSWLTVTNKGETLISDLREERVREMRRILNKLTEEELSIVARGFELVARAAEVSERKEPFGNG
ncbi:MAG TPA: MarR family transcriptional regulator [Dehalococcoidia bacterium]|nr:MarR family transcriptional regulator [Dehalococcoidia bacterium]